MRQKRRAYRPKPSSIPEDVTPVDLGATARQVGLFETGNGWQHGIIDIFFALGAVLLLLPLGAYRRRMARNGRARGRCCPAVTANPSRGVPMKEGDRMTDTLGRMRVGSVTPSGAPRRWMEGLKFGLAAAGL